MSFVQLYLGPRRGVLVCMDRTDDGLLVFGPVRSFDPSLADAALGALVLEQLAVPTRVVPRVTNWKGLLVPFLEAANERSWLGGQKKFLRALVKRYTGRLVIVATCNGGASGDEKGFHDLTDVSQELLPPWSASGVGAEIRMSFARCT